MREVIIYRPKLRPGRLIVLDVAPVIRETLTLVIAGHDKEQYRLGKEYKAPTQTHRHFNLNPTAKELEAAKVELAESRRLAADHLKQLQEESAAHEADPRYPLLRRFKTTDFEPWDRLTLEQLQTIAAWFDAAKQKGSK